MWFVRDDAPVIGLPSGNDLARTFGVVRAAVSIW